MLGRLNQIRLSLLPLSYVSSRAAFNPAGLRANMSAAADVKPEVATFASGCFWGTEHIFLKHYPPSEDKGIIKTAVGYTGRTDHAEAVRIEFDPAKVAYSELVEFFYRTHDPTTVDSQGPDMGTQYRSAIFTNTLEQAEIAKKVTEEVQAAHFTPISKKIVTQIVEAGPWYDAEDYHQQYLFKQPHGYQCPTHRLHW